MSLFVELKRRSVFRVAIAYLAAAWLLTEVADTLFPAFGIPDWGFRFFVIVLALGFVLALIFSWAYELTPEGLKRERDVVRDATITHLTAKRLDIVTIVLFGLALAFVAMDRLWLGSRVAPPVTIPAEVTGEDAQSDEAQSPEADSPRSSIAVLPFANRSANPEDAFFVEGIHDDLLTHISRISAIKTISRTSVLRYRETDKSIPEIAAELGVATVLEGGVQRAGDQVRINVQLIDARTDEYLWSEIYDRQLSTANLFAIQTEIAESIAAALQAALSPREEQQLRMVPTQNLPAYEAYLLGRQRLEERSTESLVGAVRYFQKAVELDPQYALAWAALADAYLEQADMGVSPAETFERSRAAVNTALSLNEELAEAHTTLATLRFRQHDVAGAEESYARARALNPNYPKLKSWYGILLGNSGRWDEARQWRAAAVELDPMSPELRRSYAVALRAIGQNEEALKQLERAIEINPDFTPALDAMATILWQIFNRHADSVRITNDLIAKDPKRADHVVWLAQHYLDLGEPGRAERLLDRTAELAPGFWLNTWGRMLLRVQQQAKDGIQREARKMVEEGYGGYAAHWHWQIAAAQLRNLALAAGRPDEALAIYSQNYPELLAETESAVDLRNYRAAIDLALVLYRKGDDKRAKALLERSSRFIAGQPRLGWWGGYWIADVQILALQGRKDEALAALRKAYDEGWRTLWWYYLVSDPNLEAIRNEPRFQDVVADIRKDMAAHMEQIREMERSGEIGPVPGVVFDGR